MEKVMYSLWKDAERSADEFRDDLLAKLSPILLARPEIKGIRLCVADSAVSAAAGRRMESHAPVPEGMLSLWVDDAGAAGGVGGWDGEIANHVSRFSAYLVAEAEPLVNQHAHPSAPLERVYGMCHVVFMSHPASMSKDEWFDVWKDSHTQVAIDTQSTFGYRQNVVVRRLSDDCLASDAIVEENFPPEAMADDHAFYSTGGDDALLQKNMAAMMESCSRFIDFEHIDVIPMSEYLIAPLVRP